MLAIILLYKGKRKRIIFFGRYMPKVIYCYNLGFIRSYEGVLWYILIFVLQVKFEALRRSDEEDEEVAMMVGEKVSCDLGRQILLNLEGWMENAGRTIRWDAGDLLGDDLPNIWFGYLFEWIERPKVSWDLWRQILLSLEGRERICWEIQWCGEVEAWSQKYRDQAWILV